ncbi:MAG: hypothetical protein WCO60_16765 [Verrucomicrobiota bacterium]
MMSLRILMLFLGHVLCPHLYGQESPGSPIKFAGIWLTGKAVDSDSNFPIGKRYAAQFGNDDTTDLSKKLLGQVRFAAKAGGKRLVDRVAPDDFVPGAASGKALVMACALNYEHVESIQIGDVKKVLAEIGFDLVICDFSDRSVVVSLPGRVIRTDISKGPVSEAQKKQLLEHIYSNELIKHFLKLATSCGPELLGIKSAAVTKVTILEDAQKVFPPWLKSRAEEYYSNFAGSNFYEGAGLPLLPFSRGNEVVYCAMRENLTDASTLVEKSIKESGNDGVAFVLKKPEYDIELTIPGFLTATASNSPAGKVVQNCAYARITIKKGDMVIYSEKHDANVQNIIPQGSPNTTPWLAYLDATNKLFFEASKRISSQKNAQIKQMLTECAPSSLLKSKP